MTARKHLASPRNEIIDITDLTVNGLGVGRLTSGEVIQLPAVLPGDRVKISFDELGHRTASLESPSSHRCEHPCAHYLDNCPASKLGAMSYEMGLLWKQTHLREALRRIARLSVDVPPVVPSPLRWGYRNRVSLGMEIDNGVIRVGYANRQALIPIQTCHLAHSCIAKTVQQLAPIWSKIQLRQDDMFAGRVGKVGRVIVQNNGLKESIVTILLSEQLNYLSQQISWLLSQAQILNWEIRSTQTPSYWQGYSSVLEKNGDPLLTIKFLRQNTKANSNVFRQVNADIANLMVSDVAAQIGEGETLLDLFGGWGHFGLEAAAAKSAKVAVLDISSSALKAGEALAAKKKLNVYFAHCDLTKLGGIKTIKGGYDSIVVDPPFDGLTTLTCNWLNSQAARKLFYVSCHPAALARDLALLTNYRLISVKPYDMFPQTTELETIAVLERV